VREFAPNRNLALAWLSLFASTGTLLCCALPLLLVSLGLGAAVVGLTGALPWLIPLSQLKGWIFLGSAGMIVLAAWLVLRSGRHCPAEPSMAARCQRLNRWNRGLMVASAAIWCLGFFAAYLLLPVSRWIG